MQVQRITCAFAAFCCFGTAYTATLSNAELTVTIRDDNAAIQSAFFDGTEFFFFGTPISDYGLQLGEDRATFRISPIDRARSRHGLDPFDMTVVAEPNSVSAFGAYTTEAFGDPQRASSWALFRRYHLVDGLNALAVTTELTNVYSEGRVITLFDTFDPDQGADLGFFFVTRNSVETLGDAEAAIAGKGVLGYEATVIIGSEDPRQVTAAGAPFAISRDNLNNFISNPFKPFQILNDNGLHVGMREFVPAGETLSYTFVIAFGSDRPAAEDTFLRAIQSIAVRIVTIDFKPDSQDNTFNLGSRGTVPIAIISEPDFDAARVDPETVLVAEATVRLKGNGSPMSSLEDVNGDGLLDLLVHIESADLQLDPDATDVVLEGELFDGGKIKGTDELKIVP